MKAASVGGGRIRVTEIDGVPADFGGDSNTLIIHNEDTPGCIAEVTAVAGDAADQHCLHAGVPRGHRTAMPSWCWNAIPTSRTRWNSSWL